MANTVYYRRYRLERRLSPLPRPIQLPSGFALESWNEIHLEAHAEVLHGAFRDELDCRLFPAFGTQPACRDLVAALALNPRLIPEGTLVATCDGRPAGCLETLRDAQDRAFVQNIAVLPQYRRLGLGTAMLVAAIRNLASAGFREVWLEATARNASALRLYYQLDFQRVKTTYREVAASDGDGYAI